MDFHYNKHHKTYVTNFNNLTEQASEALDKGDHKKFVSFAQNIKFNGGGHFNHTFFWESLAPIKSGGGVVPETNSDLNKSINAHWGSLDNFITQFSA